MSKSKENEKLAAILKTIFSDPAMLSSVEQERFLLQINGFCTHDAYGYTYADPDSPGSVKLHFRDQAGRRLEGNAKYVDSQVENPALQLSSGAATTELPSGKELATNASLPVNKRIDGLRRWVVTSPVDAGAFILDKLASASTPASFRNALVFVSEDVTYEADVDREKLANELQRIAIELVQSKAANGEAAAWSAIRRFASLTPVHRLEALVPFLQNSGGFDTRLVALQSILYALEIEPVEADALPALRDRVFHIASKLIDADVLTPGENSAILETAICILFAMNDKRAPDCLRDLTALGWTWLTSQIQSGLAELRESILQNLEDEPSELLQRLDAAVAF